MFNQGFFNNSGDDSIDASAIYKNNEKLKSAIIKFNNIHLFSAYILENDYIGLACKKLVEELPSDNCDFDRKFDSYIVGSFIFLQLYIGSKYKSVYTVDYEELVKIVGERFTLHKNKQEGSIENNGRIIKLLGDKTLTNELPFDQTCFDELIKIFELSKDISLNTRLAKYFPNLNTDVISPPEQRATNSWCTIL